MALQPTCNSQLAEPAQLCARDMDVLRALVGVFDRAEVTTQAGRGPSCSPSLYSRSWKS